MIYTLEEVSALIVQINKELADIRSTLKSLNAGVATKRMVNQLNTLTQGKIGDVETKIQGIMNILNPPA